MFVEGVKDELTCGYCKTTFEDWVAFRDHRLAPCTLNTSVQMPTPNTKISECSFKLFIPPFLLVDGEPIFMYCFICKSEFEHSWNLVKHLRDAHGMGVWQENPPPEAVSVLFFCLFERQV